MEKCIGISSGQIRAGRALLNWSQEDLASATALSIGTIRKLELGNISPRYSTTHSIRLSLERAGLEFIEPDGMRRRPNGITIYDGIDAILAFFENIRYSIGHKPNDICIAISESTFLNESSDFLMGLERTLSPGNTVSIKCLLTEGLAAAGALVRFECRSLSRHYVDPISFISFGDKYSLIDQNMNLSPKIIVFQSSAVAENAKRHFYSMWEKAMPLQLTKQVTAKQ